MSKSLQEKASFLGSYLRQLRSKAGLSLRQVEALSRPFPDPVAFDFLSRAESGRVIPSPKKLVTLARVYEVPAQNFLDALELAQFDAYTPSTRDPEECRRLGIESLKKGDFARAFACFRRGLDLLRSASARSDAERADSIARMRNDYALSLMKLGKHRLAQNHLEQALSDPRISDFAASLALCNLSSVAYQVDQLRIAEGHALAAVRLARRARNDEQIARSLITLANVRFDLKEPRLAAGMYRRALKLLESIPASIDAAAATINLGNCYHELGQHERAHESYRLAAGMAEQSGNTFHTSSALMSLGRSLYRMGRIDEARSPLIESRLIALRHDYRSQSFHSTYYLWRIAIEGRVGSEALELFRALKHLRLRVDQRSEEILLFDAYLREVSARKPRKTNVPARREEEFPPRPDSRGAADGK